MCWYSEEVFDTQQFDSVYQFGANGLYASVSNYCGEIQFGILINDDLSGVPNCDVEFYGKGRHRVAKIIALEDLAPGDALSMDYGLGYWQYSLSHYYQDPGSASKLLAHVVCCGL